MHPPVILADADNTLWDTDSVFADAQLGMLANVDQQFPGTARPDPLEHVRAYDQALAQIDRRHLRYPPVLLVRALELGNLGHDPVTAARMAIAQRPSRELASTQEGILAGYFDALARTPALLPGVMDGLELAREAGLDVWILTEGAADRQRTRAQVLGIADLVRGVSEAAKIQDQFDRQRRRFAPSPLVVIGDQPDRDILPAQAAGCIGVLVPSRFRPAWIASSAWSAADHVSERFDLAVDWVIGGDLTSSAAAE
jgi:putative hydrolase of the HAD superfamily